MDRERLKEVHQTDLTESRVNEDFVDWLKTKGPTWLLAILLAVTAYLGIARYRQHKQRKVDEAWAAYFEAALPGSKEDVADQHADIFAVPELALLDAGSQLLRAVQQGKSIDQSTNSDQTTAPPLTDEQRQQYLDRADRLFSRVLEKDDGSAAMTLHAIKAINGRAAVAESRGEVDAAREYYQAAEKRAGETYPQLATMARHRAETVQETAASISFSVSPPPQPDRPQSQATIEPGLAELLFPTGPTNR